MGDTNVIATLVAAPDGRCSRAFALEHNRTRYQPPEKQLVPFDNGGTTPLRQGPFDDEFAHKILLTFDRPPKQHASWVFGSDASCDVQLVDPTNKALDYMYRAQYVSRRHFAIAFDQCDRIVVRDFSSSGMSVSYDGQGEHDLRRNFTWIVFSEVKNINIHIPAAMIKFRIDLTDFKADHAGYLERVHRFRRVTATAPESGLTMPLQLLDVRNQGSASESSLAAPLQLLNMQSRATTAAPSGIVSPTQRPIYLKVERLGNGTLGTVYKVLNVSTGDSYAAKTLSYEATRGRRKQSEQAFRKEVDTVRHHVHEHIVEFVDFQDKPRMMLVMELAPLKNLRIEHKRLPLSKRESSTVLFQSLQALAFLHLQKVAHRDLKPENILVMSRRPLHVKLADFGLAKQELDEQSGLKSWCGTKPYAAPEMEFNTRYSVAVDMWSIGVVALELVYRLPSSPHPVDRHVWHHMLATALDNREESDTLSQLISSSMLQLLAQNRKSAQECLTVLQVIIETWEAMEKQDEDGLLTPTQSFQSSGQQHFGSRSAIIRRKDSSMSEITERHRSAKQAESSDLHLWSDLSELGESDESTASNLQPPKRRKIAGGSTTLQGLKQFKPDLAAYLESTYDENVSQQATVTAPAGHTYDEDVFQRLTPAALSESANEESTSPQSTLTVVPVSVHNEDISRRSNSSARSDSTHPGDVPQSQTQSQQRSDRLPETFPSALLSDTRLSAIYIPELHRSH